jgi:hypothetical protein
MKENVGRTDQALRAVAGPALMGLGYVQLGGRNGSLAGLSTMLGGALLAESAVTRVCPISRAFGLDTRDPALRQRDVESCSQALMKG